MAVCTEIKIGGGWKIEKGNPTVQVALWGLKRIKIPGIYAPFRRFQPWLLWRTVTKLL